MNGGVTTGGPAGAVTDETAMIDVADVEFRAGTWRPYLHMAAEAEVRIANGQQLGVDRPMRAVAAGAAFAQCGMFEYKRPRLCPMALGTGFVPPCHREAAGRLHNVQAMRVVALGAIHFAFRDRMMLGQVEFSVHIQMALKAGLRIFARVDDKFFASRSADRHVFTGRSVARFASVLSCGSGVGNTEPGVGTGGERTRDFGVTIHAGFVADKGRAFDHGGRYYGSFDGGAGIEKQCGCAEAGE